MSRARKPEWLKTQPPSGERFTEIRQSLRERDLNTVCEEANCPNLGECWSGGANAPPNGEAAAAAKQGRDGPGTATFMLLGERCSRGCNFCDVGTGGVGPPDPAGPEQGAGAGAGIGLGYVVLTSVDRGDLPGRERGVRRRQHHPQNTDSIDFRVGATRHFHPSTGAALKGSVNLNLLLWQTVK